MKPYCTVPAILAITLFASVESAQATEEGVFLDPATGNYTVRYIGAVDSDAPGLLQEGTYFVSTKIEPVLASAYIWAANNSIRYGYAITNRGQQPLIGFVVPCVGYAPINLWESPVGWRTIVNVSNFIPQTRDLNWGFLDIDEDLDVPPTKGLAPGSRQAGFTLDSPALPGIAEACMEGNAQFPTFTTQFLDDQSPSGMQIEEKLDEIRENDHVLRFAAIPTFPIPSPFSAPVLLGNIRAHATDWPAKSLMEPELWTAVDRMLDAAIRELTKGHTAVGLLKLSEIRAALRMKYPDLDKTTAHDDPKPEQIPGDPAAYKAFLGLHDRRLAAKVLDFDVAFVAKKLTPP